MRPRRNSWVIEALTTHAEIRLCELGSRPTEAERDRTRRYWGKIRWLLRYPEPYYADHLIAAVLELNEAVNGRREVLYGDQRDELVWQRVFHDLELACRSGAFTIEPVKRAALPRLQDKGDPLSGYTPEPAVPDKETFIGVVLKDQDDEFVVNSRVQITLPDGDVKLGRTNSVGEVMIRGFALDGMAKIELLDFCDPGEAEAVEEEASEEEPLEEEPQEGDAVPTEPVSQEKREFTAKVVDETGQGVPNVSLVFGGAGTAETVATDSSGVATAKIAADSVNVSFESADGLAEIMKPIWTEARGIARKDWVEADATTTTVTLLGGSVVKVVADSSTSGTTQPTENIEPFVGVQSTVDNPATLSVQPLVISVRMLGELFDTDKCFILPSALNNVQDLVRLHKEYELTSLLIVGHTDTSATSDYNLDLSMERTSAMRAYLTDDADSWLAWYGYDKRESKRWGTIEDSHMMATVLAGSAYPATVLGFQQWHNASALQLSGYEKVEEDGEIGPITRKQLILDYMHREGATVPEGTSIQVHGCGEYFPLDATSETLDTNAADGQHEQEDRRVEVYLFPNELGVLPPIPGEKATKGEPEYPEWRLRSVRFDWLTKVELPMRVRLHDSSHTPMPEGTPYRVTMMGDASATLKALKDGWVEIQLPKNACPNRILLEWGTLDNAGKFPYALDLYVDCNAGDDDDALAHARLSNLGYYIPADGSLEEPVLQFQYDYGIDEHGLESGRLPDRTKEKLRQIYLTDCDARSSTAA